ncbi:MAG: glycosyltransferase family 4 protein [Clostridia bacterium]|nr:glycosyltransferase family 4 protein [Clostridia bacterium]
MRLLFITLLDFNTFNESNIYTDLLREFIRNGHDVYCISPVERRRGIRTHFEEDGHLLKLKIGNIQKTNIIEKGFSTLTVERKFISAIKKYFSDIKFDLILYSTPPITFANVVKFVKKRDGAKTYLMLKDIFPQNAVDIGMIQTTGIRGLIYRYFRKKEKKLYEFSDYIGCMSQGNVEYVLRHNPEIDKSKVEVCPNCIDVCDVYLTVQEKIALRDKYGIPQGKKVFVYGGNLGRPQDVKFIVKCLRACSTLDGIYFVIAGSGTDRYRLEKYMREENPSHVKLLSHLPREEYDRMIACCDVGLIFLDHRFTIPNFPSRLLSYMQAGLPVLACTDRNTDVGKVIVDGGFGWWCESDDTKSFLALISEIQEKYISEYKENAWQYLNRFYDVREVYLKCFEHLL